MLKNNYFGFGEQIKVFILFTNYNSYLPNPRIIEKKKLKTLIFGNLSLIYVFVQDFKICKRNSYQTVYSIICFIIIIIIIIICKSS